MENNILISIKNRYLILLIILQSAFISMKGQDIIVNVKALQNGKAVSLDSIFILNESNNSTLKFGNLASLGISYSVNLSTGNLDFSKGANPVSESKKITIRGINSGFTVFAEFDKPQEMCVSIYTLDGKRIDEKKCWLLAGQIRKNLILPAREFSSWKFLQIHIPTLLRSSSKM